MTTDFVTIRGVIVMRTTTRALLCRVRGVEEWIPRSQLHPDCRLQRGGNVGPLIIPEWLADRVGLLDFAEEREDEPEPERAAARIELTLTQKTYRRLMLEHHPDKGGDVRVAQAINQLMDAVRADVARASQ